MPAIEEEMLRLTLLPLVTPPCRPGAGQGPGGGEGGADRRLIRRDISRADPDPGSESDSLEGKGDGWRRRGLAVASTSSLPPDQIAKDVNCRGPMRFYAGSCAVVQGEFSLCSNDPAQDGSATVQSVKSAMEEGWYDGAHPTIVQVRPLTNTGGGTGAGERASGQVEEKEEEEEIAIDGETLGMAEGGGEDSPTSEGRRKGPLAPMYWGIIAGVSLALLVLAIASRTASSEEKGEGRWEEEEEDRGIDTDANRTMDESDDGWCNYNVIDCTAGPVLAR